jgi:hypothetical protein
VGAFPIEDGRRLVPWSETALLPLDPLCYRSKNLPMMPRISK